jgi:hypothetical protein
MRLNIEFTFQRFQILPTLCLSWIRYDKAIYFGWAFWMLSVTGKD